MHFNYGSRNGVSEVIRLTRLLCRVYVKYATRIIAYIETTPLTSEKKSIVIAWLNGIVEACHILEEIQVTYEA